MSEQEVPTKKKSIFKKWWFWVGLFVVLAVIGKMGGGPSSTSTGTSTPASTSPSAPDATPPKTSHTFHSTARTTVFNAAVFGFLNANEKIFKDYHEVDVNLKGEVIGKQMTATSEMDGSTIHLIVSTMSNDDGSTMAILGTDAPKAKADEFLNVCQKAIEKIAH